MRQGMLGVVDDLERRPPGSPQGIDDAGDEAVAAARHGALGPVDGDAAGEAPILTGPPRHRLHLNLPVDYPRLNKWPEWFVADPEGQYRVDDSGERLTGLHSGGVLAGGLELQLEAGAERRLRICPGGV